MPGAMSYQLLEADEPPPVREYRRHGRSSFVIAVDHAGRRIPKRLGNLGLPPSELERHTAKLVEGVQAAANRGGVPLSANRVGSMFTWFFQPGPVFDWDSAAKSDTGAFARFHRRMLESGIYLPPSQYEAMFLSAAHSEEDLERTIEAAGHGFGN